MTIYIAIVNGYAHPTAFTSISDMCKNVEENPKPNTINEVRTSIRDAGVWAGVVKGKVISIHRTELFKLQRAKPKTKPSFSK